MFPAKIKQASIFHNLPVSHKQQALSGRSSLPLSPIQMAFSCHSLLLFLLLLPNTISSQTNTKLTRGTTFSPSNHLPFLLSPSRDFAFGFRPLETNSSLFLLAVWFNKISDQMVVWAANRDSPVGNKAKAELRSDGSFSLKDSAGQEIWNAGVTATYGSLLDTGNFILSSADSTIIWETFQNPTDTILPDQVLKQGAAVLYSKLMYGDYTTGRFGLTLQVDGNLVMYAVSFPTKFLHDPYYETKTSGNTGLELVFNGSTGAIYLSFPNGGRLSVMPATSVTGDDYLRATLDPDGVFRQYSFSKRKLSTGSWTIESSIGGDICDHNFVTGSGSCGFNSFCELDTMGKPQCQCPPHYSFIDPTKKYKGCKPEFAAQICKPGGEAPFSFTLVINLDWPLSDSEEFSPVSETECKDYCLKDCFCLVAIYRDESNIGTCWKKKFPLTNGRLNGNVNRKAFIKYSALNNSKAIAPSTEEQSDLSERGGL